ncbi:MAG: agmatinase [bacterium]
MACQLPYNFGALPKQFSSYETSRVVILPVPYDQTTSYLAGTRDGPRAIITASRNLELFDEELERETYQAGIATLDELIPIISGPPAMIKVVEEEVDGHLKAGKFLVMIGGEHSITLGAVRAFKKRYDDLSVLFLDAHADLRDNYQGTPYSHACVGRRIREEGVFLIQAGLRSLSKEEADYISRSGIETYRARMMMERSSWVNQLIDALSGRVYLSIDLDILDPSVMPAVGTPEPGGLSWYQLIDLVRDVACRREIVGLDVMELCPQPGDISPDFLAAKLVYRVLGYSLCP